MKRRTFLRCSALAAAGQLAGMAPFRAMNALAQTSGSSDYKALVCIFLYGGNDANNMIVPLSGTQYQSYSAARQSLALPQGGLLPLVNQPLGVNPVMPGLQQLFNSNKAALVTNVGTLVQPLTQAQYRQGSVQLPSDLFSHLDQQTQWQTGQQTSLDQIGWGGMMADTLSGTYGGSELPMNVSMYGSSIFGTGQQSSLMVLTPGNLRGPSCSEGQYCDARLNAAQQLLTIDNSLTLLQADDNQTSKMFQWMQTVASAASEAPVLSTPFPANSQLGPQLQQIAQLIQVRSILGARRQIFFAGLGSFDTHGNELGTHNALLSDLSASLLAFNQALEEIGMSTSVTTFTMSEFSRALQVNTTAGTDHAWGSHHIVMGDAVKGGKLYGTFPTLTPGGPSDADTTGRWIPTTSMAQYAATLAQWFGVPASQLATVLPVLPNFQTQNLGFV